MTNNSTIIVMIVLVFYLVGMGFLMDSIGKDIPTIKNGVQTTPQFLCKNALCTEKTAIGNIVTGISVLPIWLNALAFILPVAILIIGLVLLLLHG